jgi:antitoxin (DNA-binding transcriptional repressor) of toxin-antitoxin stability system
LCDLLRKVRRGRTLTVLDRDTPIARLVPYDGGEGGLQVLRPLHDPPTLHRVPLPPPLAVDMDIVALLLEERQGER